MKSKILDAVGISAAVLCLIHCIAFPLLMIMPLGISHNPFIDLTFLTYWCCSGVQNYEKYALEPAEIPVLDFHHSDCCFRAGRPDF